MNKSISVLSILILYSSNIICTGFVIDHQRIVNGVPAIEAEFPFMVSVRTRAGGHNCGGTILNENTILTAGHCVCGFTEPLPTIQYGVTDISVNGTNVIQIEKIICHENYTVYNNEYAHNDIALVKLKSNMILSDLAKSVILNSDEQFDMEHGGMEAIVTGWGYNTTDGHVQNSLQKVNIPLVSYENCLSIYPDKIIESNICAGDIVNGGAGQCSGDSGGPLVLQGIQIGIVSWSVKPCASPGHPGVFTRISSFYDWIKENM